VTAVKVKKKRKIAKKKVKKKWFVAYFSPNYYKKLETCFKKFKNVFKNVEMWYPSRYVITVKKNKKVRNVDPLYPGYILFKFPVHSKIWMKIVRLTPVFGFLKDEETQEPIPLTDDEIERIKQYSDKVVVQDYKYLVKNKVIITDGPFAGFVGYCKSINKKKNCAKVELNLINTLIREVEISLEMIELYD
jgi:transcriptional antiterminator NusG